jgi:hypothetical protein
MLLAKIMAKLVPPVSGEPHKEIEEVRRCKTEAAAKQLFAQAAGKLQQPYLWKTVTGLVGAKFSTQHANGASFEGNISKGDLLKIDIGGILPLGYDWVQVTDVVFQTADEEEIAAVQVHPCAPPEEKTTTHFFDSKATSTWIVYRQGTVVSAHYRGRQEVSNVESENLLRRLRDKVVAGAAVLGLADLQWEALLKGLLEPEEEIS